MERGSLSAYEQYVFNGLDKKRELDRWHIINKKREDYEILINAIKKYIDLYGTIEFNSDYTKIKRVQSWQEMEEDWKHCTSDTRRKINKERENKQSLNKQQPPTEDMWAKIKGK